LIRINTKSSEEEYFPLNGRMAQLAKPALFMLLTFVLGIMFLIPLPHYTAQFSQKRKLEMRRFDLMSNTQNLFSNNKKQHDFSYTSAVNNSTINQLAEGLVQSHRGQNGTIVNGSVAAGNGSCPKNGSNLGKRCYSCSFRADFTAMCRPWVFKHDCPAL